MGSPGFEPGTPRQGDYGGISQVENGKVEQNGLINTEVGSALSKLPDFPGDAKAVKEREKGRRIE